MRRDKHYALADTAVRSLARFVLGVMMARAAGAETYAAFILLVAVEGIVLALAQSAAVAPLIALYPGRVAGEQTSLIQASRKRTRHIALLLALAAIPGIPILGRAGIDLSSAAGFVASTLAMIYLQHARGLRNAEFRSGRALLADVLHLSAVVGGVLLADLVGLALLPTYWWLSAVAGVIACRAIGTGNDPALVSAERTFDPSMAGRLSALATPMTVGTMANAVCSRIQPLVLAVAAGATSVATFGAAATLVGPIRLLSMAFAGVLRPRVALRWHTGDVASLRSLILSCCGVVAAGTGLGLGLLAATTLAPWIVQSVFGAAFTAAAAALPWALAYAGTEAAGTTLVILLQTGRRDGARLVTNRRIAAMIASLLLIWPASARWGAAGAFAATAAVELLFLLSIARFALPLIAARRAAEPLTIHLDNLSAGHGGRS